jgi:hypothetical protein
MVWLTWIIAVGVSFAAIETWAVMTNRPTLSASVWRLSRVFPPFPAAFGLVVGFLSSHWWPFGACH